MEKPPRKLASKRHRARGNLYRKFARTSSDRTVPKGSIRPKRIRPCAWGLRHANGAHLGAIIARKPRLGSDPPENPVSYRPPPQNRFLAVTEKTTRILRRNVFRILFLRIKARPSLRRELSIVSNRNHYLRSKQHPALCFVLSGPSP